MRRCLFELGQRHLCLVIRCSFLDLVRNQPCACDSSPAVARLSQDLVHAERLSVIWLKVDLEDLGTYERVESAPNIVPVVTSMMVSSVVAAHCQR